MTRSISRLSGARELAARRVFTSALLITSLAVVNPGPTSAQIPLEGAAPAHWIWAPSTGVATQSVPAQTRYFRRSFQIKENGSTLNLDATADDAFTLWLDGKEIARGKDWKTARHARATLAAGSHVLAAEVVNDAPGPAGFLVRGAVTPLGQVAPVHTDAQWKTADSVAAGDDWRAAAYDDSRWAPAVDLGPLDTPPWKGVAFEHGDSAGRFKVPEGFAIRMVAAPGVTGSAVSFAFDERGKPCVGIERGPIARLIDKNDDGEYDGRVAITPGLSNCQGFTFHKGSLYAVGLGPEGTGIYKLADPDGDGIFDKPALLRAATGPIQEHGPHAIVVGPEGSLYFNNGNHVHLEPPIDPASPANVAYEGEVLPHLNDPRGHAVNVMAPAGEILRSDDDGKTWSRVSAGFRNHYDFAFNREGEQFTFDSDMEWDVGLPWYRPVRVIHSVPGGEYGSRNGSAVWPAYFYDSLPSILDVGRGSPTGVTFYEAKQFPFEWQDNFLVCDWSQGRILAVKLTPDGASYRAEPKELVSGQPLNCTDIEVGPDGSVFFTTGGRGTLGGLYKVEWTGARKTFPPLTDPYFFEVMGMESPQTAYSRARVGEIKAKHEARWGIDLLQMATSQQPVGFRTRALELLARFGPAPDDKTLATLSGDNSEVMRRKAVFLLGMHRSDLARKAIAHALTDPDALVRRRACEALVRSQGPMPVERLAALLADKDHHVRYAARIAIEHAEPAKHQDLLLSARSKRPALEGMLAIVRATKLTAEAQEDLLARQLELWDGGSSIDELFDLVRVTGLTYRMGPTRPEDCKNSPAIRNQLLDFFQRLPASPPPRDRNASRTAGVIAALRCEVARLLAYLNEPAAIGPLLEAQKGERDRSLQVHYAYCLRNIKEGWTPEQKRHLWEWYETASRWDAGYSYLGYLDAMVQELASLLSPEERASYLANAAATPFPARVLFRSLDLGSDVDLIKAMPALYRTLGRNDNAAAAGELRTLILEKLGQATPPEAHAALRELVVADPSRRDLIARALCENATAEDLTILVGSLESRDPNTTSQVLKALVKLEARPEGAMPLRNLLRLARRTGPSILPTLNPLAGRWTGETGKEEDLADFERSLKFWEGVYRSKYPQGSTLDEANEGQNAYSLAQVLVGVLQSPARKNASADRGKAVLQRARCLDCHKLGSEGQGLGPDLTTVASRFRPGEILESIVEPSMVISDQYKTVAIATTDGKLFTGMPVGEDADNKILLLPDGTKVTVAKLDIEDQKESRVSVMPEGLINTLSYQEIADLLALLEAQPRVDAKK